MINSFKLKNKFLRYVPTNKSYYSYPCGFNHIFSKIIRKNFSETKEVNKKEDSIF